jgi:hypothetical protein
MITEKELFDVYCHKGFSGILEEFNKFQKQIEVQGKNDDRLWKAVEILDYYANGSWDIGKPARDFLATNNKGNL